MDETTIILMEKNKETGYLEREIESYTVEKNGEFIDGIFLIEENDNKIVHLKVTTDRDVEDDEFDKIYNNYDSSEYGETILSIEEVDDVYNPTWEIAFIFEENRDVFVDKIQEILNKHKNILKKAYEI